MDFLIHLDHLIFEFINQTLASAWQDVFFPFITDLHKQLWFKITVYPSLFGFFYYKYQRAGIHYFIFCLLSLAVTDMTGNLIFKRNVERLRPFETVELQALKRSHAGGKSFISNHAANMFAFATYTTAFFPAARYVLFTIAGLIAYSRVYNGVHFPLDVICGALWGASVSLIFILLARWLAEKFQIKEKRRPA